MEKTEHKAYIIDMKGQEITLAVNHDKTSCSACAIYAFCNMKNAENITLSSQNAQKFKIGDEIILKIDDSIQKKGIILLYALPVMLIFAALFILKYFGFGDGVCVCGALLTVLIHFLVLYLLKKRFNNCIEIVREDK